MNILFIAPYTPSKIRVRPYHIIGELAKRHRVQAMALGEVGVAAARGSEDISGGQWDTVVIPHSKARGLVQSVMALPTATPMCAAYCKSPRMVKAIEGVWEQGAYDIVHVEHLRAAHFAPRNSRVPVVIDSVDCLTSLFSQMARSKMGLLSRIVMAEEAWKLRRYEPAILRRFDCVLATSEYEREELLRLGPDMRIHVVPNGVDTNYFAPRASEKKTGRIVFSGKMSYAPNVDAVLWFARNVFPLLLKDHPAAEFVIAGSDPPPEVRKLSESRGVTVTGYVSDLRPYLDSSIIAVAPMRIAVGMQNKVLEAMAMGLPVVASPIAVRAFGNGRPGVIEAASADQMLREVSRLLDNPKEASDIGRQGREEVVRHFSWRSSAEKLEYIYHEIIEERARADGS